MLFAQTIYLYFKKTTTNKHTLLGVFNGVVTWKWCVRVGRGKTNIVGSGVLVGGGGGRVKKKLVL